VLRWTRDALSIRIQLSNQHDLLTTPELLEIGDIPFVTARQKPSRQESLEYYRKVAEFYRLDVRQYHGVTRAEGADGAIPGALHRYALPPAGIPCAQARSCHRILRSPNQLSIPGEDLPKVTHYYREPHPFNNSDVVVVGAKNSAAIAALELWRHGARVTLVHRGPAISSAVKYWIKPDIENRIKNHDIAAYFNIPYARSPRTQSCLQARRASCA